MASSSRQQINLAINDVKKNRNVLQPESKTGTGNSIQLETASTTIWRWQKEAKIK
ncbi:hypothetical protein BHJ80_24200 [Escherichia coli]|nr:hypothetical protein BHJ80_24200 [Escherichia coli]